MTSFAVLHLCCWVSWVVGAAAAQTPVWQKTGVAGSFRLDPYLVPFSDIDGDGYQDFAELVPYYDPLTNTRDTQVWIMSGRDGTLLRASWVPRIAFVIYSFSTAGDIDGDGVTDYVMGGTDSLRYRSVIEVCAGSDGRRLWTVEFPFANFLGACVLGGLDVNGDGHPDVLATAPSEGRPPTSGAIYAFDHRGQQIYRLQPTTSVSFGARAESHILAKLGDIDGDGADDFVAGGYLYGLGGAALVMSGRTGTLLAKGLEEQMGDGLSTFVESCGDIDGDGVPDFMAVGIQPVFRVFSGRTAMPVYTFRGSTTSFTYTPLCVRSMDLDQDGIPDIVAGTGNGSMYGFSGRDGSEMFRIVGLGYYFGADIIALRTPGRYPRLVVSQPEYNPNWGTWVYEGRLLAYDSFPEGTEPYGSACGGSLPAAPKLGIWGQRSRPPRVTLHSAPPASPAFLLLGRSRSSWQGLALPFSLGSIGLPNCALFASIDAVVPVITGSAGLDRGYASYTLPATLWAGGSTTVFGQWCCLLQGGGAITAMSDAVALQLN